MTEITDRITPEMSEEEVLGVILDEIMVRAEPDVAETIRFCAIPHWFNEEIIAWMRGEGLKPSQRSREILAALTGLTFVGPYHGRGWSYHENVRGLLLRRWRERDDEAFKELSGLAAGYFEQKVEAAVDEERDEWARERMYHLLVADEQRGLGQLQGMFVRARNFYQLSTCALLLRLAAEQRDHLSLESQLWAKHMEGDLAFYAARWTEAREVFENLMGQELPPSLESSVSHSLGWVYQVKREWDWAIEYYEHSLAIKERIGDERGMGPTLNNLGFVYQAKGEWDRAMEYYERSLATREKMGDELGMAATFNNLGLMYRTKREWDRATEYYERSLALREKVGDEHGMAVTFNNLGLVYQAKGEWDRAIEYYERSLATRRKFGDVHGVANSYHNIGMLYCEQNKYAAAIPLFEESLRILDKIGDEHHGQLVKRALEEARKAVG